MAEITAALVKELRDKTNAGMMDCKEALKESGGDLEAASEFLRKKGISKADKKASRDASEGIVHAQVSEDGRSGVLVEINCETDFVAKNENFTGFVEQVAGHLAQSSADTVEAALAEDSTLGDGSLEETIKAKIAEIGENTVLRRFGRCSIADGSEGVVASYIHMQGKVGVLVDVSCGKADTPANEDFQQMVRDLTLHIAFSDPAGISRDDIPQELIDKETAFHLDQMKSDPKMEGKPEQALEKILEGKMNKLFFATACLLDQGFVKDNDQTISALLEATGKTVGDELGIRSFVRFAVGGDS